MNRGCCNLPRRSWTAFLAIGVVPLFIAFCLGSSSSLADEPSSGPQQPTSTQATTQPESDTASKKSESATSQPGSQASPQEQKKPSAEAEKPKTDETGKKAIPEELTNEQCMECHNSSILKLSKSELEEQVVIEDKPIPPNPRAPFIFGELNLAVKSKRYNEGVHADTACVECHKDITDTPHQQRVKRVVCAECHQESVTSAEAGAHRTKVEPGKPPIPGCTGCHDVHYGKGADENAKEFKGKMCVDCHNAYGMSTEKGHKNLYEFDMHIRKLECATCHLKKKGGVHEMPRVKDQVARCESCHIRDTMLSKETKSKDVVQYVRQTTFTNADALKKFGYMVGAHRIPALDIIVILSVLAPLGLPVAHGGLRILTRRKHPIHLPEEKILLHPLTERIWHWLQAVCVVALIITGAMLHWPEKFPGWFDWAVTLHNWFGALMIGTFFLWLIYNLGTGRISHYFPKKGEIPRGMIVQARFYLVGIFKHEPHPYPPTENNKFNPLQKLTYMQKQLVLVPILLISGVVYMYPDFFKGFIDAIGGLQVVAIAHLLIATIFAAFLVAHIYLATTGETVGENFKTMISGYGIKSEHEGHTKV